MQVIAYRAWTSSGRGLSIIRRAANVCGDETVDFCQGPPRAGAGARLGVADALRDGTEAGPPCSPVTEGALQHTHLARVRVRVRAGVRVRVEVRG